MRVFILYAMFVSCVLHGQTLRFSHLDQKQGLSQNTATAFLQDRDGFVWVGTQDGLNRYDGYAFSVYRRSNTDTNSLPDNFILSLAEDTAGNIWIGTRNGLCIYSKSMKQFFRCYAKPEDRSAFHSTIRSVHAMNNGAVVYKGNTGEVYIARFVHNGLTGVFAATLIAAKSSVISYNAELDRIAVVHKSTIRFYSPDGKQLPDTINWSPTGHTIPALLFTSTALYINDSLDVLKFNLAHPGAVEHITHVRSQITTFALENNSFLWIGTVSGIEITGVMPENRLINILIEEDKSNYFSLLGTRVENIYRSSEGLLWIGTVGGVNVYDPMQTRFSVLRFVSPEPGTAVPAWFVMSFGQTTLWADDKGLRYRSTSSRDMRWIQLLPPDLAYTAGCFDSRGRLWLGTRSKGIIIVDTATAVMEKKLMADPLLLRSTVMDMESNGTRVWIASIGSLCVVEEDDLSLICITEQKHKQFGIGSSYFTSVCFDDRKQTYIGSALGVYRFSSDTSFDQIANVPGDENSLAYNIVNDIQWKDNRLWIATMGYGLDIYDPEKGFSHYTTSSGLANNTIYGIEFSEHGTAWMSSNEGLILFDPSNGNSRNFTMRDGLPSNEFVINKHAHNKTTGKLLFGSSAGPVEFNPNDFVNENSDARPVLSRFLVNYAEHNINSSSHSVLSPAERNVSFEFTVIDFRNQDKIRYEYQLEGFDTAWHSATGSNRLAVYTNLPYGDYKFRVRYRVSGGEWSPNVLAYSISIATPFYATTWFLVVMIFAGVVVIALIVRYISQRKLRRQLAELQLQEKIRSEKERISRDLHDNVGAQLTYVISSLDNLAYTLQKQPGTTKESEKLDQLGEFARGTMDQLRESIWAINSEHIALSELTGRWKQFMAQLSEANPKMEMKISRSGDDPQLKPTVAIEVHRIVQEAINNAFKHSGGKQIVAEIRSAQAEITITITDNGHGMEDANGKAGHYGLSNMKQRAASIQAEFSINSGANGTIVGLRLTMF